MEELNSVVTDLLETFFRQFRIKYRKDIDAHSLIVKYFNFTLKYIESKQREIRVSSELTQKMVNHPNRDALCEIFLKIIEGIDINPYQSKQSFNSDYDDGLFNDWGIHHLHLSSDKEKQSDYFNMRTEPVVFVRFTDGIAYFLDIQPHGRDNQGVWSNTDFIRIIQNNWADSIADREVPNVEFTHNLSDEEIGFARRKGLLFGVNVDGKSYLLLGHGQATSGINIMAMRLANEIWRWIGANQSLFETNREEFKIRLKEQLGI